MYTVIIVDDNIEWIEYLSRHLTEEKGFKVIASAKKGNEAVLLIDYYKPQIIILDIVMPEYDGTRVLQHIRGIAGYEPYIYVITGLGTESIMTMLNELRIDFLDIKPVDADIIIKKLRKVAKIGDGERPAEKRALDVIRDKRAVTDIVDTTLTNLGLPINLLGYMHTKTAILCALEDETKLQSVSKKLYPEVADICSMSAYAVERNIRTAVAYCNKNSTQLFNQLFAASHTRKVTNAVFLMMAVRYVKRQISGSNT